MIIKNKDPNFKLKIFKKLKKNNIDFRLVTGGCFTNQKYAKHFDYTIFGNLKNAKLLHNQGFFVGNASTDLSKQIKKLHSVLSNI